MPMLNMPADVVLMDGADEPDRRQFDVGGGSLIAYTNRAPDKDTENEDTVAIIPWGPQAVILIVADGAGGLPAGKRASLTVASSLAQSLQVALDKTMLMRTAVLNGIEAANDAVRELANGSATTLTLVTIEGHLARTYQIGDSEAMIVGQRGLIRAHTTPHSPTGFAVEAGFLDERAALYHADRHLVSNFIGTINMTIDVGAEVKLQARDTVVIASDGLTDNVYTDEIVELIRKGPLEEAADALIDKAVQRMATQRRGEPCKPDDLSLLVYRKS